MCSPPHTPVFWQSNLPLTTRSMLTYTETVNVIHQPFPEIFNFELEWKLPLFLGLLLSWKDAIRGCLRRKKRDRFPTKSLVQEASKAASQLHETLCVWASVQEFLSFFNSKLITNTNTTINKISKQITNNYFILWNKIVMKMNSCISKAILTSVPLFCILKPFPSVILKGIFLNESYFF